MSGSVDVALLRLAVAVLLSGCRHDAPALHTDYLEACIAASGREYYLDANTSHCPPADVSYRCRMPSGKLLHTRGAKVCREKGGYPMGTKPVPKWLDYHPENSN